MSLNHFSQSLNQIVISNTMLIKIFKDIMKVAILTLTLGPDSSFIIIGSFHGLIYSQISIQSLFKSKTTITYRALIKIKLNFFDPKIDSSIMNYVESYFQKFEFLNSDLATQL